MCRKIVMQEYFTFVRLKLKLTGWVQANQMAMLLNLKLVKTFVEIQP